MANDLPPALAAALRPALPDLAQDIIPAIGREVPDYARPFEGPFGRALRRRRRAGARALRRRHRGPAAGDGGAREIYVALGRGEMRAGRSLDALLSAYRIGARLAWERFLAAGEAAGHEPRTLYRLASAIFDYIDGISAESVEGFTEERAAAEGERQRRRRALARLLARDDVGSEEVRDLARLAGWARRPRSPRSSSAMAPATSPTPTAWPRGWARGDRRGRGRARHRLGPGPARRRAAARSSRRRSTRPRPPSGRPWCPSARRSASPAPGPRTPWSSTAASATARSSSPTSTCPRCCCTPATEHSRPTSPPARSRRSTTCAPERAGACATTLRAWLDHPGQVTRVAGELHVHPQTVRYRVAQLRELFGERLEDADARFELALALRAEPPASE